MTLFRAGPVVFTIASFRDLARRLFINRLKVKWIKGTRVSIFVRRVYDACGLGLVPFCVVWISHLGEGGMPFVAFCSLTGGSNSLSLLISAMTTVTRASSFVAGSPVILKQKYRNGVCLRAIAEQLMEGGSFVRAGRYFGPPWTPAMQRPSKNTISDPHFRLRISFRGLFSKFTCCYAVAITGLRCPRCILFTNISRAVLPRGHHCSSSIGRFRIFEAPKIWLVCVSVYEAILQLFFSSCLKIFFSFFHVAGNFLCELPIIMPTFLMQNLFFLSVWSGHRRILHIVFVNWC